jgi:uncharacterized protein YkwD
MAESLFGRTYVPGVQTVSRWAMLALFAAIAASFLALQPRSASALTNCTVSSDALDAQESAFLTLINSYRAQNGKSALKSSASLNRAAAWHATDMGVKKYFSHTDSAGRSPSTRAQNCGYVSGAGENIAAGTVWDTAEEAFTAWQNSSGHNANMLNGSYKVVGIARVQTPGSPYGWYWVTDFGLVDDGGSAPPSTPSQPPAPTPTQPPQPTPTPSPAPQPPASGARLSSPAQGAQLAVNWNYFRWNSASGALGYKLDFGTGPGSANMGSLSTTRTSMYVSGFPRSGMTIYVRLWTQTTSGWTYTDSSFRAPN